MRILSCMRRQLWRLPHHSQCFSHLNTGRVNSCLVMTPGSRSISECRTINSVLVPAKDKPESEKKAKAVIFDKDGTLICFQHTWSPWARKIAAKVEEKTGLQVQEKIYQAIGYCSKSNKVRSGLLAEATQAMVQDSVVNVLVGEGMQEAVARGIVLKAWEEGGEDKSIHAITDTRTLFRILKDKGVKIAVCTSDSRKGTEGTIKELGVEEFVDILVCGDDAGTQPKPAPHNAHLICQKLGVDPSEVVMVGDTKADVGMGQAAKLGWNVGVLSGVGETNDLYPAANHVIESVKDLLPIILPKQDWQGCYHYAEGERILVEPAHLEAVSISDENQQPLKSQYSCVIFDLHGTILCTHTKHAQWLDILCTRIEQTSKLEVKDQIYQRLGVSKETRRLLPGLLNDGKSQEVKAAIVDLIRQAGLSYNESLLLVNKIWQECKPLLHEAPKALHKDLKAFFKTLKKNGIKIAICTDDLRDIAVSDLNKMNVLKYVDMIVCGDDPFSLGTEDGKTEVIFQELNVKPSETMIVGDSAKDFTPTILSQKYKDMRRVGVLTGVSSEKDLQSFTHDIVPNVDYVFDKLFPNTNHYLSEKKASTGTLETSAVNPLVLPNKGKSNNRPDQSRTYSTSAAKSQVRKDAQSFDYVIVGAGSAGSVLTNRLSENGSNQVMVLEAGPKDYLWNWKIHMPAALMYNLCDDKYNWYYHTEPEKAMNNRVMYWPRGRVWGGSSSLNAMVYIRGNALDYDGWEKAGAKGWSYANCLPYFRKSQTHELGANDYRGGQGPLHVSRGKTNHPLHQAFLEAGQQAGLPFTEDMNGYQQEGVGWMDMTIYKGCRWSTSRAYLRPAMERSNVKVTSKALTSRIIFEGTRAIGVEYEVDGKIQQALARKEVILCGGAINSPQLLMLSGVGNADDLKKVGIEPVVNLPGVGQNLQDHLEVYVQQACKKPITLYTAQWKFPHNMIRIGLQWFANQTGDGATTHLETGGFVRGDDSYDFPNIQYHFLPSTVSDHGRKSGSCHAYQLHVGQMRPSSRGFLKLRSPNPKEHPIIVANYMTSDLDIKEMRQSVFWAREVFRQKAFDEFRSNELLPGEDCQTPEQIDEFVRRKGDSAYHPSCTCKMGSPQDPMAVVDPQTRVLGTEGLRVVDASIMPNVVSGNLNGPTCMVAEKAADIILGKEPLPKSSAPVYLAREHPEVNYPSRWNEAFQS